LKENGVAAGNVTVEMMESCMERLLVRDREIRENTSELVEGSQVAAEWVLFIWKDGKFHRLPENFIFPSLTVAQCWRVWWMGNREKGVPPLKKLGRVDVPVRERKMFSDVKCMMMEIERELEKM